MLRLQDISELSSTLCVLEMEKQDGENTLSEPIFSGGCSDSVGLDDLLRRPDHAVLLNSTRGVF